MNEEELAAFEADIEAVLKDGSNAIDAMARLTAIAIQDGWVADLEDTLADLRAER